MKNLVGIIAADPNSINSEIIAKVWKKKAEFKNLNIFIIGNYILIKKQQNSKTKFQKKIINLRCSFEI
jgi:4-hydroxy-L-threonine phosphate dehydrogenase PdxA